MGENSGVEWTGNTQNFWQGCHKLSPGCKFCYMYTDKKRYGQEPNVVTRCSDATFYAPLRWKEPTKIFTCSWSDFFIEEADAWRADAWDVIRRTPHHTWQILTKRVDRVIDCLPPDWGDGWPHVWMGVSVENQEWADKRRELFHDVPALTKFVSYEPALGPVDWAGWSFVKQIISGGESGPQARPSHPRWHRRTRDYCIENNIAYFFKQWGEWAPISGDEPILPLMDKGRHGVFDDAGVWRENEGPWSRYENLLGQEMFRVGKKRAGRILDGRTWEEHPRLEVAA